MKAEQRVVVELPLRGLWDEAGTLDAAKQRDLEVEDVRDLLRAGPIRFIIANVGFPLRWLDRTECFAFWKTELRDHICTGAEFFLDDYPRAYCFTASEWHLPQGESVILLESHH